MANTTIGWFEMFPEPSSITMNASWCGIYVLLYLLLSIASFHWLCTRSQKHCGISTGTRFLFVIAHPDDECMFFGPTIISLTKKQPQRVHLLCLSRGDYLGEGRVRETELLASCLRLGIESSNVTLIHSDYFPDDPKASWNVPRLAAIVLNHVEMLDVDRVVTFDDDGVSYHGNHIALYRAVLRLVALRKLPKKCRVFALDTVGIVRKYSGVFDAVSAMICHDVVFVVSLNLRKQVVHAMHAHRSQMLWFRRLYLIASRYIFINGYTEVTDDFNLCLE